MLLQRVVTSIALLALILGAVIGLPASLFYLFILLVMGIAAWEWSALAGLSNVALKALYIVFLVAVMLASTHLGVSEIVIFSGTIVCWFVALILIYSYPSTQVILSKKSVLFFAGIPLLVPGWLSFYLLRNHNHHEFYILFLFFMVAAADIGAYFAGRTFGKHKLAVRVSPNKTWEGFVGGMLACTFLVMLTATIFSEHLQEMNGLRWFKLILFGLVIAAFSVVGDLFESMIKRNCDVKDSGSILPGHGGILDRIDGLSAAAPVYTFLLLQFGPEFL